MAVDMTGGFALVVRRNAVQEREPAIAPACGYAPDSSVRICANPLGESLSTTD
jgi:hypothetical protein